MLDRVAVKGRVHGRMQKQLNTRLSVGRELENRHKEFIKAHATYFNIVHDLYCTKIINRLSVSDPEEFGFCPSWI